MAGTINTSISQQVTNGNYTRPWADNGVYVQNGQGEASGILPTSTGAASVDIGSVTTLGWGMFCNLDGTNNIDLGIVVSAAFQAFATLKPGECVIFRLKAGVTLQAKAAAGTPNLQYWILQD